MAGGSLEGQPNGVAVVADTYPQPRLDGEKLQEAKNMAEQLMGATLVADDAETHLDRCGAMLVLAYASLCAEVFIHE